MKNGFVEMNFPGTGKVIIEILDQEKFQKELLLFADFVKSWDFQNGNEKESFNFTSIKKQPETEFRGYAHVLSKTA